MFRTHKDIQCHKATITLKISKPWEIPTGHKQDRRDTTMDSRRKRQRTRQGIDKAWRKEYDVE